ncbi:MAG: YihY/virulence factor BrkB family protein [Bacteroidales bacterium]|nr:YihY/virulence factor BrkB family protein [Bacteroidales bacterium]
MKEMYDKLKQRAEKCVLPGFQHIPLLTVMRLFGKSLVKGILFQRAAAMTYRFFIACIPMAMALFSILSFMGESMQQHVLNAISYVIPHYAWPVVNQMIEEVMSRQDSSLVWIFFAMGLYFSVIAINSFLNSLRSSYYEVPTRNLFKQLFVSLQIFVIFVVAVCVIIMIFVFTSRLLKYIDAYTLHNAVLYSNAVSVSRWLLIFAAIYFLISMLYYYVPADKRNYRFFSAGSSVATVLLVLLLGVVDIYFSDFADYNFIYGSMGALITVLLWIYWNAIVMLACFDLNVSVAEAKKNKQQTIDNHEDKGSTTVS